MATAAAPAAAIAAPPTFAAVASPPFSFPASVSALLLVSEKPLSTSPSSTLILTNKSSRFMFHHQSAPRDNIGGNFFARSVVLLFWLNYVRVSRLDVVPARISGRIFRNHAQRVGHINAVCVVSCSLIEPRHTVPQERPYSPLPSVFSCAEPEDFPLCAERKSAPNASSVKSSVASRISLTRFSAPL